MQKLMKYPNPEEIDWLARLFESGARVFVVGREQNRARPDTYDLVFYIVSDGMLRGMSSFASGMSAASPQGTQIGLMRGKSIRSLAEDLVECSSLAVVSFTTYDDFLRACSVAEELTGIGNILDHYSKYREVYAPYYRDFG